MEFMYEILLDVPPEPKSWRRYCSKLYCKWGQLLCFQKNLWNFKKILKILFKKFESFFESFKENVNKHFEKLNENYNFLLLYILIAGWGLGCSPSFALVPGLLLFVFGGGGSFPFTPGYSTGLLCTVYNENMYYAIDPYCFFPLVEEGK